jgi:plastocyanin
MNQRYGIIIALFILGGVGGYLLSRSNTPKTIISSSASTSITQSSEPTNTKPVAINAISIQGFAFSPSAITVIKGATVTWTNNDSMAHTVTETDSLTGPNSSDVQPGNTYAFTFVTVGTYHYHCSIHGYMTSTVMVTD